MFAISRPECRPKDGANSSGSQKPTVIAKIIGARAGIKTERSQFVDKKTETNSISGDIEKTRIRRAETKVDIN